MAHYQAEHLPSNDRDRLEAELLAAILSDRCYPWEPSAPSAADYFEERDADFDLSDWSETEVTERASHLFAQLDRCWTAPDTVPPALWAQFGERVPRAWLATIAERARELACENRSALEQLVACARPVLTGWADEDLQVFARPLAYAMRGERDRSVLSDKAWADLSTTERARCALEIAERALAEYSRQNRAEP